jgi:hypothetical protein
MISSSPCPSLGSVMRARRKTGVAKLFHNGAGRSHIAVLWDFGKRWRCLWFFFRKVPARDNVFGAPQEKSQRSALVIPVQEAQEKGPAHLRTFRVLLPWPRERWALSLVTVYWNFKLKLFRTKVSPLRRSWQFEFSIVAKTGSFYGTCVGKESMTCQKWFHLYPSLTL